MLQPELEAFAAKAGNKSGNIKANFTLKLRLELKDPHGETGRSKKILWDLNQMKIRREICPPPPSCTANEAKTSSQGHHREVWCLAISPNGDHLVSASHDKSLRLWERTREPVILEEEREMVRRARPGADGRLTGTRLTDCSSSLAGARGGV